jgi:hypothetical protein
LRPTLVREAYTAKLKRSTLFVFCGRLASGSELPYKEIPNRARANTVR